MKILVIGKKCQYIEKQLPNYNLKLSNNPQIIISYGGDGTILLSERFYPEIPKLFLRHSRNCSKCLQHDFSNILNSLEKGNYKIKKELKLEALHIRTKKKLIALNEINIHHKLPLATRFQVKINNKIIEKNIIGDGVIFSTPFGSTSYYQSITGKNFEKGIGMAFINPMRHLEISSKAKNRILKNNDIAKVKILRDPGYLTADNNEDIIRLRNNDIIEIKKHPKYAKLITIKNISV